MIYLLILIRLVFFDSINLNLVSESYNILATIILKGNLIKVIKFTENNIDFIGKGHNQRRET